MSDDIERIDWDGGAGRPLGRHVRHDPQSRGYAVEARSIDEITSVRHTFRTRVLEQQHGSCVPHSAAKVLAAKPFRRRFHEPTAQKWYRAVTLIDPFEGNFPPDDTGSDGLSMAKLLKSYGLIGSYLHAFSFAAFLTALQRQPVMVGTYWRAGQDYPNANGLVRYVGARRGGHEYVADEIDVERRLIGYTNSWGPRYALMGRFYMSWADAEASIADRGDVTVLLP